jgi:hypothetical protein
LEDISHQPLQTSFDFVVKMHCHAAARTDNSLEKMEFAAPLIAQNSS